MENSETTSAAPPKRVKHRSPSYPSIDLAKAIQRTQQLWDVAGKHPAPLESAMKSWGYSPKSSGGLQTVASLKQYGLVEDSGTGWGRHLTLTKLAQELLVYGADKDSSEWKQRAGDSALRPKIHKALWDKFEGSLPADSVMFPFLKLDLGFSDDAATDMLKRFRATLAFAAVSEGIDTVSDDDEDSDDLGDDGDSGSGEPTLTTPTLEKPKPGAGSPPALDQRTVQITYSPTSWALIQAPFPMSEADWTAMIETLNGMKRGLVQPDE